MWLNHQQILSKIQYIPISLGNPMWFSIRILAITLDRLLRLRGLGMYNPGIFMHLHLLIHPITSLILLRKVMGRGRGRNTVLKIFRKYILLKVMRVTTTEEENRGKLSIFFPMEIDTADQLWEEI